jgi:hypothetical protein
MLHSCCIAPLKPIQGPEQMLLQNHVAKIHKTKSKVRYRSINFSWCVIPVHKLLKRAVSVPKLNSGL